MSCDERASEGGPEKLTPGHQRVSCRSCGGLPEATLSPLSAPRTFAAASHTRVVATAAAVARHVAVQGAGAQVVGDAGSAAAVEREPRERAPKAARPRPAARPRTRGRRGGRLRSGGESASLATELKTLQVPNSTTHTPRTRAARRAVLRQAPAQRAQLGTHSQAPCTQPCTLGSLGRCR